SAPHNRIVLSHRANLSRGRAAQLQDLGGHRDSPAAGTDSVAPYETLSAQWVPHTLQLSSEARAYRQKNPSAYQATLPRGPRGEITAGFGIRHEVTLVKGASGWRLAEDAYDE